MTSPTPLVATQHDQPEFWPPDRLMTRQEASALARVLGVPLAVATLAKLAVRGGPGAPVITYFNRKPLYRVAEFRGWVEARCVRARSTSEAERRRSAGSHRPAAEGAS